MAIAGLELTTQVYETDTPTCFVRKLCECIFSNLLTVQKVRPNSLT